MQFDAGGGPAQRRSPIWVFFFCFMLCRLLMPIPPERAHRDSLERINIICISDTAGKHRQLHIPRADLLIHSGNFARTEEELADFNAWLGTLRVTTKVVIAGDTDVRALDYSRRDPRCLCCPVDPLRDVCPSGQVRDCVCHRRPKCCNEEWTEACVALLPRCGVRCDQCYPNRTVLSNAVVLQDTQTIVEGLKIYGTSWQSSFRDRPFYVRRDAIREKWASVPRDVDILITHVPPLGRGDRLHTAFASDVVFNLPRMVFGHLHRPWRVAKRPIPPSTLNDTLEDGTPAGDHELLLLTNEIQPRLHVFGQTAAGRGIYHQQTGTPKQAISINAVVVDPNTGNVLSPYMWPLRRMKKMDVPLRIE